MNLHGFLLVSFVLFGFMPVRGQILAGADGLGRVIPQHDQLGPPKVGKQVGMFYFLWHGDAVPAANWDLSELVTNHPEVLADGEHDLWGSGGMYYWGKPIYGYYHGRDIWVHLRSMQLLTDAGVDFVVIDVTNHVTYPERAHALMSAMDSLIKQQRPTPKIVFYTFTKSGETMQLLYDQFYKPGAPYYHPDCWYYLDGKPLVIGKRTEAEGRDFEQFFTYRESQWPNEPMRKNGWPWISFQRPQEVYENRAGEAEIISVSVAQHPDWEAGMGGSAFYGHVGNRGRSFHNGYPGNPAADIVWGYNFQEQWGHALQQDVPFVFVTGWNEWIAPKLPPNGAEYGPIWFCDQASPEYSRDIEPSLTSGLKDHYYMQLVHNIRRYKGVDSPPPLSNPITISDFHDWEEVRPVYEDYVGETTPRDYRGAPRDLVYRNYTGRNDLHRMKVARDSAKIYFYAETVSDISKRMADNSWMRLYIDVDRSQVTGWLGYDYRVLSGNLLECYRDGNWDPVGVVTYNVRGNKMMISVARELIGLGDRQPVNLEFKWSDNMQQEDPLDWYVNGDVAPGGRFNFIAIE